VMTRRLIPMPPRALPAVTAVTVVPVRWSVTVVSAARAAVVRPGRALTATAALVAMVGSAGAVV
ncbi:MAG: hypothetical protein WAO90_14365, partial [Mycobacterium sp.]